MLLQILFCSFNTIYPRPLLPSPCSSNQPCINIDKSQANFQEQQKRLSSQKRHIGHGSKRKLNLARIIRGYQKWGLCSKKCWKTLKVKIGHEKIRKKKKKCRKRNDKKVEGRRAKFEQNLCEKRRQAKWCQGNKCWSRNNNWDNIKRESKGTKEWEKKNVKCEK